MKVATSQFDKNDKSTENLSAQNEILSKKIEEAEKKVKVYAEAVKQAEKETGENSTTTKKWQTDLNDAQAELNKLNRQVEENAKAMAEATDTTKEEADAVEDFGKEADKSGDKALSLGDIIKANLISDAIKGGLQTLANGIKAVGGAMSESLSAGAEYADTILTLSVQTGLSTDTLEKYNAVAELTDVSLDTLTNSMAKNIKSMSDARDGSKAYAEAYEKLGVKITDGSGNLRDSETVYWETVDALKGVKDETERDALAMELFGKKAQDLNTIIEMGSEGVKEYEQKAVEMGAVLGGKGLEALGNYDDQMQTFTSTLGGTKNILASAFAPAMADAMGGVNDLMGSFNGLISAVIGGDESGIESAMTLVSEQVTLMVENVASLLPSLIEIATNLISTLIQVIIDNLPYIVEQGMAMLTSLLQGIMDALPELIPVVLSVVETLLNTVFENLPMIIEMGMQMLVSLVQGIADMLPTLIPTVIDALLLMVDTILDNIDLIIDAGIELVLNLAMGLVDALPRLIEKIPIIIDKLLSAIFNNFPLILDAGIEILLALADGLIVAIPQLLESLPLIISKLISGLLGAIPQLITAGGQLLAGLFKGLLNPTTIWNAVKSLFNGIVGGIKELFGIHSPSTVMADVVGANLALGLGEGFDDTMGDVAKDMANAIPTEFDAEIGTNLNVASGQAQMSTYDTMVRAFKQALTEVSVVMDDREMGRFVTKTVERAVFV